MDNHSDPTLLDEAICDKKPNSDDLVLSRHNEPTDEKQPNFPSEWSKLPREFRGSFFRSLDLRFMLALVLSAIIHIGLVRFLPEFIPDEFEINVIQKMHKRFVDTILKENAPIGSSGTNADGGVYGSVKSGRKPDQDMARLIEEIILGIVHSGSELPDLSGISDKILTPEMINEMRKAMVPTAEMRHEARQSAKDQQSQSQKDASQKVRDVGLLGVITGGRGMDNYEYIANILENANARAQNLESILKQVNALKVPRFQRSADYLDQDDVSVGLKTGRVTKEIREEFYEQVEPLAQIDEIPVARNTEVDVIGSPLAGLNKRAATNGKTRSYQHISKIVASHNKTIQDCYKQILRYQPNLKGKIVVRFSVDPSGKVVQADLVSTTLNHPKIENCVLKRIRRWKDFGDCDPKLGTVSYQIPYNFGL